MTLNVTLVRAEYSKIYGKFGLHEKVTSSEPPPLGLCYIAPILETAGHEVRIIDGQVERKSVEMFFPSFHQGASVKMAGVY